MNRGLVAINGLVLSVVLATSAFGQSNTPRKSIGQRMADMRRSWTQDEEPVTVEEFPDPQDEGRSLMPKWLGGGSQKKSNPPQSQRQNPTMQRKMNAQQQQQQQQPSSRADQPGARQPAPQQRAAAGQNAAPAQHATGKRSTPTSGFTLPGLGGAPLPPTEKMSVQNRAGSDAASNQSAVSPENDPDYPVIRDTAPQNRTPASETASNSAPRHSPMPRTPRNVEAQNARREFSGPPSTSSSSPAARTADAGQRTTPRDDTPHETVEAAPRRAPVDPTLTNPTISNSRQHADASRRAAPRSNGTAAREVADAFGAPRGAKPAIGASDFARSPRTNSLPAMPSAARSREAFGEAPPVDDNGDPSVLVSQQTPLISSDIRGPKQIIIGRESLYRVRLQNQGTVAAEGIVATIHVPASAEIVGTSATQGTLQPAVADGTATKLEWQLSNLSAHGSEVLDLRLVPKEGKPLELGVNWTVAPVGSRAVVEVQEPQLKIEIGGPTEVMYDKPQMFRLTLSNPGTGPAEKVRIELIPPGGTDDSATSHDFGDLAAGESRSVDIELTPREAGKLTMKAKASAEGGLASDVGKEIFCRKPELELDWRGPANKYAGTPATYFFRIRNPGTAPAEDVTVKIELPEGAEFTSGSEGQRFDAENGQVTWRVGTLNPGDDSYMELKCVVNAPGTNKLKVTAANAAGDITSTSVAETIVEALADLKLTVSDPSGPVAVGSQALYEIHVENRGADTARDVNIVALFSEGIEPDQSESYTVSDGRVSFSTIKELPAGQDVTLRVRARALQPGTHVFRAEVLCSALEIKLAAEETTRFYADEVAQEGEEGAEQTAGRDESGTTVR